MKNLLILIILFTAGNLYPQNLQVTMTTEPFEIADGDNGVSMAGVVPSGLYDVFSGMSLKGSAIDDGSFTSPEILVLYDFLYKKEGDKNALLGLYDDDSRQLANAKIIINATIDAYKDFDDFELLSKNEVEDFVRVRYNLVTNDGRRIPWVLMMRKIGQRYFLTETISADDIFVLLSASNPYNYFRQPYAPADVSGLKVLNLKKSGEEFILSTDEAENGLRIFLALKKYELETIEAAQNEIGTLKQMATALINGDKNGFITLWDAEEQMYFNTDEFYEEQVNTMISFYERVNVVTPAGSLKIENEIVVFYYISIKNGNAFFTLVPMREEAGKFVLIPELENYSAWAILNIPVIQDGIKQLLQKF